MDLSRADESVLLYSSFLGDVVFAVDDTDFSARWGWIPILDFARNFFLVVKELPNESQFSYEFTESDAAINLRMADDEVIVSATYVSGTARISYEELLSQTHAFVNRILKEFGAAYPLLKENPIFLAYQAELG